MTNESIIRNIFNEINNFKRARVLAESARQNGETSQAIYHNINQFKSFDSIELYVRSLQANIRYNEDAGIEVEAGDRE